MSRYPGATWKPLPQNATQPKIKPVGVVLHTAVSNGSSLYNLFDGHSDGVESNFYVRKDGSIEQYMDSATRADCQLDGNSWLSGGTRYGFVSIETWDGGKPDSTPWNAAQLASIAALVLWLSRTHGFPLVKATGVHGHGVGYHAQFTTPASSSALSFNHSHSCPTPTRIKQVPGIIARAVALSKPPAVETAKPTPPKEEDALPTPKDVWTVAVIPNRDDPSGAPSKVLATPAGVLGNIEATQDVDHKLLVAIAAALAELPALESEAVKEALKAALADAVVHVDVNVSGGNPA